jgi:DNA anti-recombination protein RmuC
MSCETCDTLPNAISIPGHDHVNDHAYCKLEVVEAMLRERDRLYTERAQSQQIAVAAALAAQKEAATKAEHYQADYNVQHNDLMRKMDHQVETFIGRSEYTTAHTELGKRLDGEASQRQLDRDAIVKQIVELREFNSKSVGMQTAVKEDRTQGNWSTGVVVSIVIAISGWLVTGLVFLTHAVGK